jgi:hypothetical protein
VYALAARHCQHIHQRNAHGEKPTPPGLNLRSDHEQDKINVTKKQRPLEGVVCETKAYQQLAIQTSTVPVPELVVV